MLDNKFTEEDKKNVIDFLNMIAHHAEFKLNTQELIQYFKLLSKMQQVILPKIDANIFEIKRIIVQKPEEKEIKKSKK